MRICWHSHSPLLATGYGKPTALWLPKLRDMGYEVMATAFHGLEEKDTFFQGIPVVNADDGKYGATVLKDIATFNNVDAVITLMDVWALDPGTLKGMRAFHWFPVDTDPLSALDDAFFRKAEGLPVSISQQGERLLSEAGFKGVSVPYSYDQRVFYPDDSRRERARRDQALEGYFVVGINAAPVPRKAWTEQLSAFSRLQRNHPGEVVLLINTSDDPTPGLKLPPDAFRWTGGLDDAEMADWYRMLDVLSACSYAEGFGLPILEAQACGTPVIVTDAAPVNEEPGLLARKVTCKPLWNQMHHAYWHQPSVAAIHEALEDAFAKRERDPAITEYVQKYTVDAVAPQWDAVLRG
jgi:glycosyltransferase involved in cell wall biosynthesis